MHMDVPAHKGGDIFKVGGRREVWSIARGRKEEETRARARAEERERD